MRLAGTCSRYSKRAMPQLASAAIHQGLAESSFRCAYHAKVMNTLEATSRAAESATAWGCMSDDPFDALAGAARELLARRAEARDGDVGRKVEERREHERPLVHARMGKGEALGREHLLAVEQEVEVERARRVGKRPLAPVARFQLDQCGKELARGQGGAKLGHAVDEIGLRRVADGRGAVERRACRDPGAGQRVDLL